MRRQQAWLLAADRIGADRKSFVAVCVFLNMRWTAEEIAEALNIPLGFVRTYAGYARPLLRQSRRAAGSETCTYCGIVGRMGRDHVMPRSRGGTDDPHNLVPCCQNCNSAKGDRTPEEWLG